MAMMSLRLSQKDEVAQGIVSFELRHPDGLDLPPFTCGGHLSLEVPNGMLRKYSLSNDPAETDRYVITVKRETAGRGGSISLHDDTKIGDLLQVGPLQNDFELVPNAAGYIFVAGGIGITPILSMIHHLTNEGGPRFKLYYLSRNPETTAFREMLTTPAMRGRVVVHHDEGDPANAYDLWPVFERPTSAHVYCCGPRLLMDAVRDMTGHWSAKAIHFEAFSDATAARADNVAFQVELARSGDVIDVPANVTLLDALRAHGCEVASSCESGTCGSCRTGLLDGDVDHRDLALTDEERARAIMVCVSRGTSGTIVLDL